MKKTYELVAEVTISVHTDVKAASIEEALQIAQSRGLTALHATWCDDPNEYWCTSGELDGAVQIIEVDGEPWPKASKSDIAAELAWRDVRIAELEAELEQSRKLIRDQSEMMLAELRGQNSRLKDAWDVECGQHGTTRSALSKQLADVTAERDALQKRVAELKRRLTEAHQLVRDLWERQIDWTGPIASSHFRSDISDRIRALLESGKGAP